MSREPENDYYRRGLATELTNWGNMLAEVGRPDEAERYLREAVQARPGLPNPANNLAWFPAKNPTAARKTTSETLKLAQEAVDARPNEWMFWNPLGLAKVREGDWKGAIAAIEESIRLNKLNKGGVAHDWFVLSIARWHLGEKEKARDLYEKAVEWMAQNPEVFTEELRTFRAEAAKVLKLPTPMVVSD